MSMILSLKQAPVETLELLVAQPKLAVVFWMDPDYKPPQQPGWVRWLARMLGGYTPPMELPEAPPELNRSGQAWRWDSARYDFEPTLTNLDDLPYGSSILGSTHGYGDDRAVWPIDLPQLGESLAAIDQAQKNVEATQATSFGLVMKLS